MLVVQKFGGTSVGDLDRIQNVANIVKKYADEGNQVVVVVSAMAGETNKLLDFANHFTKTPPQREVDLLVSSGERVTSALLSIALQAMGKDAIALTGRQAGIKTTSDHTKARIMDIDPSKMKKHLDEGKIVIIAGFQGINENGDVTTLGRGGSDLTAVAIAGALNADKCEIYTDVDGIYTTDPRIEPKAKKIDMISYDEMLELASLGAKVMQSRSVELAKKLNVDIEVKSSFKPEIKGTLITKETPDMEKVLVSGIALDKNQARVSIFGVEDRPGISAEIFGKLADKNINVDMIVQNVGKDNKANLTFTVPQTELELTKEVLKEYENKSESIEYDDSIAKVSVVGVGMKSHSGVAATAFKTLADENINILMISTSEIKISMVIDEKYGELAVRALHKAYQLDK
ncbi:asparate kinase, monofunctional class [Nautilia profundicola AmH]|uniref:Aspartokinase n=1 Tax=Nautilia profundicola (strain ATCC BAA-1463 / DSM 18972 / AmH) TaxID=598659 RepID=B9LAF0_NAUPA|nr:aspartate kinase [Nautilia profundicola]ACM93130.1 asparate kinase, monofunctional class [Nautilia profundicola AmH]